MSETVEPQPHQEPQPKVICLCGSTRFIDQFAVATWVLELRGHIVLGCTLLPAWYCQVRDHFAEILGVKVQRDDHHLRKIDLSDDVLVLDIGGYIGESTRNEIAYATAHGKPVRYVSADAGLLAAIVSPQPVALPAVNAEPSTDAEVFKSDAEVDAFLAGIYSDRERVEQAEKVTAELLKFVQHLPDCAVWPEFSKKKSTMMLAVRCSCGRDAAIANAEASR